MISLVKGIFFFLLLIPLGLFLQKLKIGSFFGYVDEVFVLFCALYAIFNFREFGRGVRICFFLLAIAEFLGLVSNFRSDLVHNYFAILIDAFWLLKIPASFFVMEKIASKYRNEWPVKKLRLVAAIIIVSAFVCGVITLFFNTGMSDGTRYGIPSYHFLFGNSGQCGVWIAVSLLWYLNTGKNILVEVFALVTILFTTKGIPFMALGVYCILIIMYKCKSSGKIRLRHIALIAPILFLMATFQINSYLEDIDHPRMVLMSYGVKTANDYAPLGAGFATYGSEMARRYYSPLYVKYGFNHLWGLQDAGNNLRLQSLSCLNDIYYFGIIAELGWLGFAFFAAPLFWILRAINQVDCPVKVKSMCFGVVASLFIAGLGSGMTKSALSVFAFASVGYIVGFYKRKAYL